jgi:hypothetical protein
MVKLDEHGEFTALFEQRRWHLAILLVKHDEASDTLLNV